MSLLDILVSPAAAQAAPAAPPGGGLFQLGFLVVMFVVFWFLLLRPQMKRAKEHRAMLEKLAKGDEVITSGGIAGVIRDIGDSFISVEVADGLTIRVQKGAIGNVLPKGTLKSL